MTSHLGSAPVNPVLVFPVKLWSTNLDNSVASIEAKANVCCVKFSPSSRYHLAFGCAGKRKAAGPRPGDWMCPELSAQPSSCEGSRPLSRPCSVSVQTTVSITTTCGTPSSQSWSSKVTGRPCPTPSLSAARKSCPRKLSATGGVLLVKPGLDLPGPPERTGEDFWFCLDQW